MSIPRTDGLDKLADALGWHLLPVDSDSKSPLLRGGHHAASQRPEDWTQWQERWPRCGWAVALAASGLAVVDADSPEAVAEAEELLGETRCPVAATPSGGRHFVLKADGLPLGRWVRRGRSGRIDLLSDGFLIIPPGPGRQWLVPPWEAPPPPPPPAVRRLFEQAAREAEARRAADATPLPQPPDPQAVAEAALARLPGWFREEWGMIPEQDRSGHAWHLARRVVELGVKDQEEIAALVVASAAHRDKFADRRDAWDDACRVAVRALAEGGPPQVVVTHNPQGVVGEVRGMQIRTCSWEDIPEDAEEDWLIYGLIPTRALSLLVGRPRVGKSLLARQLAADVAAGRPFLGRATKAGRVLYVVGGRGEGRPADVKVHFRMLEAPTGGRLVVALAPPKIAPSDVARLLEEHTPDLFIIDTLRCLALGRDLNDYVAASAVLAPLAELTTHATGVVLHHANRLASPAPGNGDEDSDLTAFSLGSTALPSLADTVLVLRRRGEDRVLQAVHRAAEEVDLVLTMDRDRLRWVAQGSRKEVTSRRARDVLLALAEEAGPEGFTASEALEALAEAGIKVSERHVRRLCVEVGLHRYGDKRGARWGKPPVVQVAG